MKKLLNEPATYFITYIVGFMLTFGHAYHAIPSFEEHQFGGQPYTVKNGPGTKTIGALLASIGWPLYWSVQAYDKS